MGGIWLEERPLDNGDVMVDEWAATKFGVASVLKAGGLALSDGDIGGDGDYGGSRCTCGDLGSTLFLESKSEWCIGRARSL